MTAGLGGVTGWGGGGGGATVGGGGGGAGGGVRYTIRTSRLGAVGLGRVGSSGASAGGGPAARIARATSTAWSMTLRANGIQGRCLEDVTLVRETPAAGDAGSPGPI